VSNIIWEPQPAQAAMISCPVFEIFFGGARGGGKTDAALGEWIVHADQYGEHAIGIMFRRQRVELIETIERSRQLYLPLGAKFNEQEKFWRFPNGARLRFAYLERDSDADSYQGQAFTRVYIEEIGNFPSRAPIAKLMATLRSGHGVPVGFRSTGNPGGPGHNWVKDRYISPAPGGFKVLYEEFVDPWTGQKLSRDRVFIPSRITDNKYLGADYIANLQMVGSTELVRAWLEGDWDVVEGAFFDGWSHRKHVVRPFGIPEEWLRFRSMDWGYASPASIGWWAVVGDDYTHPHDGRLLPRGALVRYKEWYVATGPNTGARLDAERIAQGIIKRDDGDPIAYSVLDPAAFSEDGGPSIAERMARAGVRFRKADNRRIAKKGAIGGWDQMRARLRGHGDVPMLYCFETCTDSIRTIPVLQHDKVRPEDLDTEAEDHAADEWRYACMSRPWLPNKKDLPKPRATELAKMTLNELWETRDPPKRIRV
jgi:hypothetical protein